MNKAISSKKRGLSNAIVTLILLGVAAVAGGIILTTFLGGAGTASQTEVLRIADAKIIVNPDTQLGTITVVVKNEGSGVITVTDVDVASDGATVALLDAGSDALNPGESKAYRVTSSGANTYTIGKAYLVTVDGTTQDNRAVSASTQVIAGMS